MNDKEILRVLGQIEGKIDGLQKLAERVANLEMWLSWLRGACRAGCGLPVPLQNAPLIGTPNLKGETMCEKVLGLLLTVSLVLLAQACVAHYSVHPASLNKTDSAAYDALLIAETVIDQAKAVNPAPPDDVLERLIDSYNVARESWLTYRGAINANVPQPVYLDNLNKNLMDLADAIQKLREPAANASPTGR